MTNPTLGEVRVSVDELAQIIRAVDGDNSLGAGALAEALLSALEPIPSPPKPEHVEGKDEGTWRDLALQFDGHRIECLSFLRYLSEATTNAEAMGRLGEIKAFLAKPPLSGEAVLAARIAASTAPEPQAVLPPPSPPLSVPTGAK